MSATSTTSATSATSADPENPAGSGPVTFASLGVPDSLVRSLAERGIHEPFPVQAAALPDCLAGRDVLGEAPTGSGKTLAFGLGTLARVDRARPGRPRSLVLAPTRELAEQIRDELATLAPAVKRRVVVVYGGASYGPQRSGLRKGADILVATPGRLEDLIETGAADLSDVDIVVLDEADRMADMGFMPAVRRLLNQTRPARQTLLFSATLDGEVGRLSRQFQNDPVRHAAPGVGTDLSTMSHHFWSVDQQDRVEQTAGVIAASPRTIVFTRTRHGADRLSTQLGAFGVRTSVLHGGHTQGKRERALRSFSTGRSEALIATDVAARGIHVDSVSTVVHYDPPADHKDYVHRSGRTARAGESGAVVSLVMRNQRRRAAALQRELDLTARTGDVDMDALLAAVGNVGPASGPTSTPRAQESSARESDRREKSGRSGDDRSRRSDRGGASEPQGRQHSHDEDRRTSGATANSHRHTRRLHVSNLPFEADDEVLHAMFAAYGRVAESAVVIDRRTGRSRGFGFVSMPKRAAARAVEGLDGTDVRGRRLRITDARVPAESARPGGGGRNRRPGGSGRSASPRHGNSRGNGGSGKRGQTGGNKAARGRR